MGAVSKSRQRLSQRAASWGVQVTPRWHDLLGAYEALSNIFRFPHMRAWLRAGACLLWIRARCANAGRALIAPEEV
jgi:hypothetical protein